MSDSNCLSVGADTKPRRMWPHGEANLHFRISHPHSDGDTHCSLYKMVVIVKMNMMIVRVMGAPVVAMSVMMIACYCCQWRRWVFHRLQTHSRYLGCIRMTVGVQASISRTGETTLGGMNVSGLQACHWHTRHQLFLDYIVRGSKEGFKHWKQFTEGCLEVSVFLDFCIYEFRKLCYCQTAAQASPFLAATHALHSGCLYLCHFGSYSSSLVLYSVEPVFGSISPSQVGTWKRGKRGQEARKRDGEDGIESRPARHTVSFSD